MINPVRFLPFLFLLVLVSNPTHALETKRLNVVTTVAPITNIVQNVGAGYINVTGIVPDGSDSHTFEPTPSDVKILAAADIIIVNSLDLELATVKLAEKVRKPGTPIIQLGNHTLSKEEWRYDFSFPREHGHPNPHLWPNIALAMRYAEITQDSLIAKDPHNEQAYAANTKAYLARLKELDEAIFGCVESIPEKNRKLVTYHDSFAYFAPRYGLEIIAAIQPASFSEPGPQEVIHIIKQIKKENIPAVFGSRIFPSKAAKQIARETGAKYIDQLSDDELPAPPNHSFIGMMVNNIAIMTRALGGNQDCVATIDTRNITP